MRIAGVIGSTVAAGAKALTGAQAQWIGCEPGLEQRIYFANHSSHLDFILVWSALPAIARLTTRPVAAADYWCRGAMRRYLIGQVFQGVLIERGGLVSSPRTLKPVIDALDEGSSLILFPEGSRGSGDELQTFRSGIYYVSQARPSISLIPVWIENGYRVLPKGTFFPVPLLCSVRFGCRTHLQTGESKEDFLQRLRASVQSLQHP